MTRTRWDRETLPQGEEKVQAVREMFDAIAPRYDLVNRIMTFRLDVRWRRRAVRDLGLPPGSLVLDLAGGTGDLCVDLRRAAHRPISVDLSLGMLVADRSGAPRVQADILRLPVRDAAVDGATCGFALRNLVDLDAFFAELARVVRPGGRIALLDVGLPRNPIVRAGHRLYFGRIVPLIGGLLSDSAAYRYLPRSVAYLPEPIELVGRLEAAGFRDVHHRGLTGGITQLLAGRADVRAITRPADTATAAIDLNDVARGDGYLFVRDGVGLAARGVAARSPVDEAPALLAAIEHDGPDGVGPVALGCLPFEPGAPAELVVPSTVLRKTAHGERWVTIIDGHDEQLTPPSPPPATTSAYTIEPVTPPETYLAAVAAAREAVRAGTLTKAVIAREIAVTADRPIDLHGVLHRLKATFGSSYRYSVDGFIGASPELLVEVEGRDVRSHPLAGTAPRTGNAALDAEIAAELIASTKNQVEHRVVIDVVHDTLLPWCSYLDWEPEPSIVEVANVQHLGTQIEGRLSRPAPSVLELARALSPTPALGGHPREAALALIAAVEGVDRGRYGGAVGWVDANGNGTWAVAIRCAELAPDRRRARLHAGGGIVADSDPLAELAETQAKFQAMLSALIRP